MDLPEVQEWRLAARDGVPVRGHDHLAEHGAVGHAAPHHHHRRVRAAMRDRRLLCGEPKREEREPVLRLPTMLAAVLGDAMSDFDRGFRAGVEAAANAAQEVKNEPYSEVDLDDETLHWRRGMARGAHRAEVAIRALQPLRQPDATVCVDCGHSYARHLGDEHGYFPCNAVGCTCKHVSPSSQQPDTAPSVCAVCNGTGKTVRMLYGTPTEDVCAACLAPWTPCSKFPECVDASPAVAVWRALSESDRHRIFGLLENDITGEAAVACDLLRSLAPEAGDADGGSK